MLFNWSENGTVILETLLDAGADLNARTSWGDTAIHNAALSGTLDSLKFLLEEGISVSKPQCNPDEAFKIAQKAGFTDEWAETMNYDILQKVGKSSCINKATHILDMMMHARNLMAANKTRPFTRKSRERAVFHKELNQQETEFLMLSKVIV